MSLRVLGGGRKAKLKRGSPTLQLRNEKDLQEHGMFVQVIAASHSLMTFEDLSFRSCTEAIGGALGGA